MHDYLFSHENEKENMFSNNSAVVIEFYVFQSIANNPNWRINARVGWTAIRLDTRTYDALTAPSSSDGMKTDGLVIESDGDLVVENSKYLTVEVLVRLVSERHPAKNLIAYSTGNLPILPSFLVEGVRQGGAQPVYMQVTVPKKAILPAIQPPNIGTMIAPPLPVSPS